MNNNINGKKNTPLNLDGLHDMTYQVPPKKNVFPGFSGKIALFLVSGSATYQNKELVPYKTAKLARHPNVTGNNIPYRHICEKRHNSTIGAAHHSGEKSQHS